MSIVSGWMPSSNNDLEGHCQGLCSTQGSQRVLRARKANDDFRLHYRFHSARPHPSYFKPMTYLLDNSLPTTRLMDFPNQIGTYTIMATNRRQLHAPQSRCKTKNEHAVSSTETQRQRKREKQMCFHSFSKYRHDCDTCEVATLHTGVASIGGSQEFQTCPDYAT